MRELELVPTFTAELGAKILPNAFAAVDVDGDDITDLVVGSMSGVVAVYKISAEHLSKYKECKVNGCVTAMAVDATVPNDMRLFVATAEGTCYVFQATESGDEFRPSAEFHVSSNVCDVELFCGHVLFGTREGRILVFAADANALGGFRRLRTHDLGVEIEALTLFPSEAVADTGADPRLVVHSTMGEIFEFRFAGDGEPMTYPWSGPGAELAAEGQRFLVPDVRVHGATRHVACGAMTGKIELRDEAMPEVVWQLQLDEAIVGLDRLPLSSSDDLIMAATWSGDLFGIRGPDEMIHFRSPLPAAAMFCVDLTGIVPNATERVLVLISTSGVLSIYRELPSVLAHALRRRHAASVLSEPGSAVNTEKKRRAIMDKARCRLDEATASAAMRVLTAKKKVTIEDIVRLATLRTW